MPNRHCRDCGAELPARTGRGRPRLRCGRATCPKPRKPGGWTELQLALRLVHPLDLKPIMDWVGVHGDQERAKKMLASLPALPVGTAWVWWPAEEIFERIQVRLRSTFDSGRTPKPGERGAKPRVLAKVDLAQLGDRMKAAAEQARANDPRELKKQLAAAGERIKALEARKSAPAPKAAKPVVRTELKTVKVPVLVKDWKWKEILGAQLKLSQKLEEQAKQLGKEAQLLLDGLETVDKGHALVLDQLKRYHEMTASDKVVLLPAPQRPEAILHPSPPAGMVVKTSGKFPSEGLTGPEQRILDAVFWWGALNVYHPSAAAVAPLADYSVKSSGFEKARGMLRSKGLIEVEKGAAKAAAILFPNKE